MPAAEPWTLRERVSARAQAIRIEVRPGNEVVLVIPQRVTRVAAHAFLASRAPWVRLKLAELAERARRQPVAAPLRWDDSDRLAINGELRRLRRVATTADRPALRIGEELVLLAPTRDLAQPARLDAALKAGLVRHARQQAVRLLDAEAARLGVDYSGPRIADQKSRWGSCTPRGLISLNWRLVMAPPEVFRYVVVHELCHRRHLDHSPRFWRLVAQQMPEHAGARGWLRQHGHSLHAVLARGGASAAGDRDKDRDGDRR